MAGKISLVINAILALAVIYLFTQLNKSESSNQKLVLSDDNKQAERTHPSIAYVNNDSLSLKYKFRIDKSKILEKASIDVQTIENKIGKAQEDYYEIMNKAQNNGFANDEEMYAAENKIKQLEKDMPLWQGQMEKRLKRLTKLESEINDSLYARLYRYMDSYASNKPIDVIMLFSKGINGLYTNGKLDITQEVIEGLNNEYELDQSKSEE